MYLHFEREGLKGESVVKRDNVQVVLLIFVVVLVNVAGIYFASVNPTFLYGVTTLYLPVFFIAFIISLMLSAIKERIGMFFGGLAFTLRALVIAFMPVYIYCLIKSH